MAEQYVSINIIMDKIMRHPLLSDLTLETAVDYTVDFMRIVGVPRMFLDRIAIIPIVDYVGILPTDWVDTIQVKYNERPMRYSSDLFYLRPTGSTNGVVSNAVIQTDAIEKITEYLQLNSMDDIAFGNGDPTITIEAVSRLIDVPAVHTDNSLKQQNSENTFAIQGGSIHTSMPEGQLVMAYRAIATDEEGYPLLPDNSKFTRALTAFIKYQHFTILFDLGKIHANVLEVADREYCWAVGACENEFKRLDLSKAETFFNSYSNLILRSHEFEQSFKNSGRKESLRNHY